MFFVKINRNDDVIDCFYYFFFLSMSFSLLDSFRYQVFFSWLNKYNFFPIIKNNIRSAKRLLTVYAYSSSYFLSSLVVIKITAPLEIFFSCCRFFLSSSIGRQSPVGRCRRSLSSFFSPCLCLCLSFSLHFSAYTNQIF